VSRGAGVEASDRRGDPVGPSQLPARRRRRRPLRTMGAADPVLAQGAGVLADDTRMPFGQPVRPNMPVSSDAIASARPRIHGCRHRNRYAPAQRCRNRVVGRSVRTLVAGAQQGPGPSAGRDRQRPADPPGQWSMLTVGQRLEAEDLLPRWRGLLLSRAGGNDRRGDVHGN